MLRLNENIEEQTTPQEEIIDDRNYLTSVEVRSFIDDDQIISVDASNNISQSIYGLTAESFKDMLKEAVKDYMEEMKNAAS